MENVNYITPTGIFHNHETIVKDCETIIQTASWADKNQILLNSRQNDKNPWHDGVGAVTNRLTGERLIFEQDFKIWNTIPEYILKSLLDLKDKTKINFGRIRIMRLEPHRGLSVHKDLETRYHYVLQTNKKCYFGFSQFDDTTKPAATCWHIPQDGQWYHVDTTKLHFVYNGGETDRIHIVVCALR
jgi:hypothetical protein